MTREPLSSLRSETPEKTMREMLNCNTRKYGAQQTHGYEGKSCEKADDQTSGRLICWEVPPGDEQNYKLIKTRLKSAKVQL